MKTIYVILISVVLTVAGQLLWKIGAKEVGEISITLNNFVPSTIKLFTNLWVVAGCLIFIVSSILWVVALTSAPLSFVFPFLSLGYVLIYFVSWLVLKEQISDIRIVGMVVICIGVILIAKS